MFSSPRHYSPIFSIQESLQVSSCSMPPAAIVQLLKPCFSTTVFRASLLIVAVVWFLVKASSIAGQIERMVPAPTSFVIPRVLIIIQTSPELVPTRVKDIRETWGKRVHAKPSMKLIFATTDQKYASDDMWSSGCSDGYFQAICKLGYSLERAFKLMKEDQFDWLFFGDDDIYVLPDNLQHLILELGPEAASSRSVFGVPGCADKDCVGFCGGAGFLLSRTALEAIIEGSPTSVDAELQGLSRKCGDYHDVVFGHLIERDRNMTMLAYPQNPYVWGFDSLTEYFDSFSNRKTLSWLYHYPSRDKMRWLHHMVGTYGTNLEIADAR